MGLSNAVRFLPGDHGRSPRPGPALWRIWPPGAPPAHLATGARTIWVSRTLSDGRQPGQTAFVRLIIHDIRIHQVNSKVKAEVSRVICATLRWGHARRGRLEPGARLSRVKPFKNVTFGSVVEPSKMLPKARRRKCGKVGIPRAHLLFLPPPTPTPGR